MEKNEDELKPKPWTNLPATEAKNYILFHKNAFEEDLKHSEKNILQFPRWSIISGYYCMHNITKLFLAYKFNIRISSPEIHSKTIDALYNFIRDDELKKKLIELLKEAKTIYYSAERLKEKILPALLIKGKQERGKAQYYSEDYSAKENINAQKASYFLETIVKPYVGILRELIK